MKLVIDAYPKTFKDIFPPIDLPKPNLEAPTWMEEEFDKTFQQISERTNRANRPKGIAEDAFRAMLDKERARFGRDKNGFGLVQKVQD